MIKWFRDHPTALLAVVGALASSGLISNNIADAVRAIYSMTLNM
jgi:hypothetical protein